jgi:hypothetical protein
MKRALLIAVGTLFSPALALAQSAPGIEPAAHAQAGLDPDAPPPTVHVVDDPEPKTPLVPRAADLLGSHVLLGAAVGPAWSLGQFASNRSSDVRLGTGLAFRADVGFGVSRSVVLGAWGTYAGYTDGTSCADDQHCSGRAFSVGPYVRYHLSQGLRFDPWLTLGAGYRRLAFDDTAGARQKFSGIEWLHFELGADYYVFSGLGVGPYASLGLSTYTTRPSGSGDATVNTELSTGLRFLFDLPGR